jgi:hypothetical protein
MRGPKTTFIDAVGVKSARIAQQRRIVMHNKFVGQTSAKYPRHIHRVAAAVLLASVAAIGSITSADARRGEQYFIPPPPPTPVLAVPPPPAMLPYSEAYANYKAPPTRATQVRVTPLSVPMAYGASAPQAVRSAPNLTGLSLHTAKARGFGKPRVSYRPQQMGPGAASAAAAYSAPAMNTWFDSSLRWYSQHSSASNYYNALANQAPYFRSDAPSTGMPQPMMYAPEPQSPAPRRSYKRHFKRVVANR